MKQSTIDTKMAGRDPKAKLSFSKLVLGRLAGSIPAAVCVHRNFVGSTRRLFLPTPAASPTAAAAQWVVTVRRKRLEHGPGLQCTMTSYERVEPSNVRQT